LFELGAQPLTTYPQAVMMDHDLMMRASITLLGTATYNITKGYDGP